MTLQGKRISDCRKKGQYSSMSCAGIESKAKKNALNKKYWRLFYIQLVICIDIDINQCLDYFEISTSIQSTKFIKSIVFFKFKWFETKIEHVYVLCNQQISNSFNVNTFKLE